MSAPINGAPIVAAVRLARENIASPSPRIQSAVADSVALALDSQARDFRLSPDFIST
jgi:hypothetical protein